MVETIPEIIHRIIPYYKEKGEPDTSHMIVYDSSTETLEPIYFYIIDLMEEFGMKPEKLIDNFDSSPGSGHFGELGQRATIMQQQGGKILGDINTVLRSVLNIIYDLKEFKIRLQAYDDYKTKDKKEAAILSLKQIWMDKVDMQKGNSSIKAMALGQAGFQTLIDAFLAAQNSSLKYANGKEIDLNDRVKRILIPRLQEFEGWLKHSGEELTKRYELEKNYLRSQVNSLKLYSRWAKPYLIAAQQLETSSVGSREPALVKTFNTIILELTLLGKEKLDIEANSFTGDLPVDFRKMKPKRDYYSCILIQFRFRGIPQKVVQQSHYAFGGKAEITFSSYSLNKDELDKLDEELKQSDIEDTLKLIEGTTTESLDRLQDEINYFLEEKSEEEEKGDKDTSNPFLALLGFYNKSEKPKKEELKEKKVGKIKPDDWIEKTHFRPLTVDAGKAKAFKLFDIYKKSHKMQSFT